MVYSVWVELGPPNRNDEGSDRPSASPRHPAIFLVFEGQRPFAGGVRVLLSDLLQLKIGRGSDRGFVRDGDKTHKAHWSIPDSQLSTMHARIFSEGSAWYIEDQGARSGTFVDSERLPHSRARRLRNGAFVELGATFFLFRESVACDSDDAAYVEVASAEAVIPDLERLLSRWAPVMRVFLQASSANAGTAAPGKAVPLEPAEQAWRIHALRSVLLGYDKPLTAHELERALVAVDQLATTDSLASTDVPEEYDPSAEAAAAEPVADEATVELKEEDVALRAELLAALKEHGGNITHVATALGRTRMQIHRWLRRWSIDSSIYRK